MKFNICSKVQSIALSICKFLLPKEASEDQTRRDFFINLINLYSFPIFLLSNLIIFAVTPGYKYESLTITSLMKFLTTAIFLISCRWSNRIYKLTNTCLMNLVGPLALAISSENLLFSIIAGSITPIYTLLLFQDQLLGLASFFIQFMVLNIIYLPVYIRQMEAMTFPQLEDFLQTQAEFINIFFSLNMLTSLAMFFIYKNSSDILRKVRLRSDKTLVLQKKLFYKFSNEMKNSLNGVIENLDMAYVKNIDPQVKTLLSNAKVSGELLLLLMSNILDGGKMEIGDLESSHIPAKMMDTFEKAWKVSSEMIKNKGLHGQLTVSKRIPAVLKLDSYKISQIMLNLVRNAVRFTDTGRITISCDWIEEGEVSNESFQPIPFDDEGLFEKEALIRGLSKSFTGENDNTRPIIVLDVNQRKIPDLGESASHRDHRQGVLKITVSDTGSGMDEANIRRIFTTFPDLFTKSADSRLPVKGLNMWITHQLCAKMNGEIRVYSRPDRGSTFIVCINAETPHIDIDPDNSLPQEDDMFSTRGVRPVEIKIRALVIDGNPYNTSNLRRYLEANQVEVIGYAKNGIEVLILYEKELVQRRTVNMILLDLDMPTSYGKAVCEKIREYETLNNLSPCSIVVVSGNCFESEVKECLDPDGRIKANHFLRKPVYFSEFQRLMVNIQNYYVRTFREPFRPKKVLIVNQSLPTLRVWEKVLTMFRYESIKTNCGSEAIEMYKRNWRDIALILMDCEMPEMNGQTTTKKIREFQEIKQLPKIRICGMAKHSGIDFELLCEQAGMNRVLCEPIMPEHVINVVSDSIRAYE